MTGLVKLHVHGVLGATEARVLGLVRPGGVDDVGLQADALATALAAERKAKGMRSRQRVVALEAETLGVGSGDEPRVGSVNRVHAPAQHDMSRPARGDSPVVLVQLPDEEPLAD